MTNLIGRKIEKYRIEALLGEGGMGAVYRAKDVNLGRSVALKVMHPHLARRAAFQQRFLQEAQAAATLDHTGIAKVFDFGQVFPNGMDNGLLYMVMEYIGSGSLADYIHRLRDEGRVVQLKEMLYLVAQAADALDYAHRHNVVHRDMKPDNILLKRLDKPDRADEPPLRTLISDFGLAKLLDSDPITAVSTIMGTLAYMSPEQALSRPLDGRSDLYSLGVVLYQLATGRLPFNIKSPTDAVYKHQNEMPPSPRSVKPELPEAVAAIIEKSLAKSPRGRYQSGELMAAELRRAALQLSQEDVTQFAPENRVLSLVTELQPDPVAVPDPPSRLIPDGDLPEGEYLIVSHHGQSPRLVPLNGPRLTVGRSRDNDVVLDEEGISRRHARLERSAGGWQVVDVGSRNGTYLDGSRLLPDYAETWRTGRSLRIGSYFLNWQRTAAAAHRSLAIKTATQSAAHSRNATVLRSAQVGLSVIVRPNHVNVKGGESESIQVELFNESAQVGHYHLEVDGLPDGWYSLPEEPVQLLPNDSAVLPVSLHPPRHPRAESGPHKFRLAVITNDHQNVTAASPVLLIDPYSQLAVDIRPSQISHGDAIQVSVENQGNHPASIGLTARDPADALQFQSPAGTLTLPPGAARTAPLRVQARRVPLLGTTKTMPFEVVVQDDEGNVENKSGQVSIAPRIPAFVVPLMGLLMLLLCGATFFGVDMIRKSNAEATRQAIAAAQTAEAAQDNDGDGLSNQDELTVHKTDPNAADSDGDGLNDGDEVLVQTTNPHNPDTDNDGLNDGAELNAGTDPKDRDTDKDGLPDGQDPDPVAQPTATATLTPLPTATSTALPTATPTSLPTATPTTPPTATPTATETATPSPTATSTSTPFLPETIVFDHIPNEPLVTGDRFLDGDEYQAMGILLAGAPESSYCSDGTGVAIRRPGTYNGVDFYFLTTASPGQINRCNGVPVEIRFVNPVREVRLTYAGASVTYVMKVYSTSGSLLATVEKDTVLAAGTFDIEYLSGSANIGRVTFGYERAITAVKEIYYRP